MHAMIVENPNRIKKLEKTATTAATAAEAAATAAAAKPKPHNDKRLHHPTLITDWKKSRP